MPYHCQRTLGSHVVTVEVPNLAVPRCSNCGDVVFDYAADEQIRAAFQSQFGPGESAESRGGVCQASGGGRIQDDPRQAYKLIKLIAGGLSAVAVGLALIATGEPQAIVAGSGALLAATLVFGFLYWANSSSKGNGVRAVAEEPPETKGRARVLWLGIGLTLLPGLLYFYLRYSLDRFDPMAIGFVIVPLVIAGLGCIGVGLWSATKR